MKIKFILYTLCFSLFAFSSVGCSDDDNIVEFNKNVTVDINDIEIDPGKEVIVKITDGNGDYAVKSTDETIATGTVDGTSIKVQGHKPGLVSLIITDEKGVSSVVKVLVYGELTLESVSAEVTFSKSVKIKITSGNGDYSVKSTKPEAINPRIELEGTISFVVIEGIEVEDLTTEGIVTVTDKTGRSIDIAVKSSHPYASIISDDTERMEFAGIRKEVGDPNVVFANQSTSAYNNTRLFEWVEDGDRNKKRVTFYILQKYDLKTPQVLPNTGNSNASIIFSKLTGYGLQGLDLGHYVLEGEILKYDKEKDLFWFRFVAGGKEGVICMKQTPN